MLRLTARRRVRELVWSICNQLDPAAWPAVAPIYRYAVEVWKASSTLRDDTATLSIKDLAAGFLGASPTPGTNLSWSSFVKGPASACIASLVRIGWSTGNPFILTDDLGKTINLFHISPRQLLFYLKAAFTRSSSRKAVSVVAARLPADISGSLCEDGIYLQPLQQMFSSAKLSAVERSRWLACVTGGYWTNSDLQMCGLSDDDLCPLCRAPGDSVIHRCYICPASEHLWSALPTQWLKEALSGSPANVMLYSRCIVPTPRLFTTDPVPLERRYEFWPAEQATTFSFNGADGPVYWDGSCFHPSNDILARAGWAAVQVNQDGTLLKAVYGNVPANVGQSANAAEHMGAITSLDLAASPLRLRGDCLEVVRACQLGLLHATSHQSRGATCWRVAAQTHPVLDAVLASASHVKAHRAESEVEIGTQDWLDFKGNEHADLLAKEGAAMFDVSLEDAARVNSLFRKVKRVALHIGRALALWPSRPSVASRRSFRRPAAKHDLHQFAWDGRGRFCSVCLRSARSPSSAARCPGSSPIFGRILSSDFGHKLWAATIDRSSLLIFCNRCGAFSERRAAHLARPCGAPSEFAPIFFRQLRQGLHPTDSGRRLGKPWRLHCTFSSAAAAAAVDCCLEANSWHLPAFMPLPAPADVGMVSKPH